LSDSIAIPRELARLKQELVRLTNAIAAGGESSTLVAAIRLREHCASSCRSHPSTRSMVSRQRTQKQAEVTSHVVSHVIWDGLRRDSSSSARGMATGLERETGIMTP
jgi:hypothetical protein